MFLVFLEDLADVHRLDFPGQRICKSPEDRSRIDRWQDGGDLFANACDGNDLELYLTVDVNSETQISLEHSGDSVRPWLEGMGYAAGRSHMVKQTNLLKENQALQPPPAVVVGMKDVLAHDPKFSFFLKPGCHLLVQLRQETQRSKGKRAGVSYFAGKHPRPQILDFLGARLFRVSAEMVEPIRIDLRGIRVGLRLRTRTGCRKIAYCSARYAFLVYEQVHLRCQKPVYQPRRVGIIVDQTRKLLRGSVEDSRFQTASGSDSARVGLHLRRRNIKK